MRKLILLFISTISILISQTISEPLNTTLYGTLDPRSGSYASCYGYTAANGKEYAIIGNGSYSDISELERLGCKFFNIGCGYYKYHSSDAYASTNEIHAQVDRFVNFYKTNHNVFMPHPK